MTYSRILTDCIDHGQKGTRSGYGKTMRGTRQLGIHRAVYQDRYGEIPNGLVIMHLCDNPRCINTHHLVANTQSNNQLDAVKKGRHSSLQLRKLNSAEVADMRSHGFSQREIARLYGVSRCAVRGAIKRHEQVQAA